MGEGKALDALTGRREQPDEVPSGRTQCRLEPYGGAQLGFRLVQQTQVLQGDSEVVVSHRRPRFQREGGTSGASGLDVIPRTYQMITPFHQRARRRFLDGRLDRGNRHRIAVRSAPTWASSRE